MATSSRVNASTEDVAGGCGRLAALSCCAEPPQAARTARTSGRGHHAAAAAQPRRAHHGPAKGPAERMAASAGAFPWSEHEPDVIRRPAAGDRAGAAKRRRRRLFQTTKTEDRVMVAAATRGLRKPSAASGMASTL